MLSKSAYSLGLKIDDVSDILANERALILDKYGKSIGFVDDDTDEVGQGFTDGLLDGKPLIVMGTKGFPNSGSLFTRVSDLSFARALNCLFHERRHLSQTFEVAQESDAAGLAMACSLIAVRNNPTLFHEKQLLFMCEIDARAEAFRDTVDWFVGRYGRERGEAIVLNGFNKGFLGRNGIPGSQKYKSVQSVNAGFEASILQVQSVLKRYPDKSIPCDDEVALALHLFDDSVQWRYFRDVFNNTDCGMNQEVVMAVTHLYLHPELKQYYGAFSGIDMAPGLVLGRGFPESRESMLRQLPGEYLSAADKLFLGIEEPVPVHRYGRDTRDLDSAVVEIENNMQYGVDDGFDF